jgi:hypothetical protein
VPAAAHGAQVLNPVPCLCGLMVLVSNGGVRTGLDESALRADLVARILTDKISPLFAGCPRSGAGPGTQLSQASRVAVPEDVLPLLSHAQLPHDEGVSRISRSRCQPSTEAASSTTRRRSVNDHPKSYTSAVPPARIERATPRFRRTVDSVDCGRQQATVVAPSSTLVACGRCALRDFMPTSMPTVSEATWTPSLPGSSVLWTFG